MQQNTIISQNYVHQAILSKNYAQFTKILLNCINSPNIMKFLAMYSQKLIFIFSEFFHPSTIQNIFMI